MLTVEGFAYCCNLAAGQFSRSRCFSSRLLLLSLHWTGQISAQTVT